MVKHILFVKLKDSSEKSCKEATGVFEKMRENIDFIKELKTGIDFLHSERSFDIILETTFENKQDFEKYQQHPYHVEKVKSYMHAHRSASATVDYEF